MEANNFYPFDNGGLIDPTISASGFATQDVNKIDCTFEMVSIEDDIDFA